VQDLSFAERSSNACGFIAPRALILLKIERIRILFAFGQAHRFLLR
jgi:hypothetical protein